MSISTTINRRRGIGRPTGISSVESVIRSIKDTLLVGSTAAIILGLDPTDVPIWIGDTRLQMTGDYDSGWKLTVRPGNLVAGQSLSGRIFTQKSKSATIILRVIQDNTIDALRSAIDGSVLFSPINGQIITEGDFPFFGKK